MAYYLLFILYLLRVQTMEMVLDKKQNSSNFLIQVQNEQLRSEDNSQHQQHIWPRNC